MFLVAGLGNPGKEYQGTRHNVGFMAADEIYRRFAFGEYKSKFQALIADGQIAEERVLLVKPQTFMNLSGNAIVEVCKFYKILPAQVIIIHDDMDLPVGALKTKIGGGTAGHNGLKSITAAIGSDYGRIRVGVGRPVDKSQVADWVLSRFSKQDEEKIHKVLDLITENIETYIKKDCAAFASLIGEKVNGL